MKIVIEITPAERTGKFDLRVECPGNRFTLKNTTEEMAYAQARTVIENAARFTDPTERRAYQKMMEAWK